MRALLLVAAAALCGCAAAPQGLSQLTQPDAPQPAYYKEYHETLTPGFAKTYNVSIAPGAKILNATLVLDTQMHGLPAPGVVPATADLAFDGKSAHADPSTPSVRIDLPEPLAGKHQIRVNATGPSETVEGSGDYGTTFILTIQVGYA